ncbi:testis-specific expressed protein 55 isoform X2 [Mustela lutreola]|uniref:testis-specific expressed protein 55 isoform X2 n=1 Tax=Mustela lutreola TaxID=9666 RepID=UPI0027975C31|nr:testis-specific expressed protein 55 isoform X2 [Mustela lutreola]
MEEPPEEAPAESLAPESTAKSPDDSHTDGQEDNWQNQDEENVEDQTDPRTVEQAAQRMSGQTDRKGSEPTGLQASDQMDLRGSDHANVAQRSASDQDDPRMYAQTDRRTSRQSNHVQVEETDSQMFLPPEQRTSEQSERRKSPHQAESRDYGQIDRRISSQTEPRAYEQSHHRSSVSSEQRASEQIGHRMPSQSDNRTLEQIDSRLSGLVKRRTSEKMDSRLSGLAERRTSEKMDSRLSGLAERRTSEKIGHRPSNQADLVPSLKTHQDVYEEAADQADRSADHLFVDNADYSEEMEHLMAEENYYKDYLANYGAPGQYDDRIFAQFGDIKAYKEAEPRIEPCEFETKETTGDNSPVSVETDNESETYLPTFGSFSARFTSDLQAKDQVYSQRFPYISPKLDYIISQEKTEAVETKPDDVPEHQEGRKSFGYNQTYRRQFPPIVYEDPYQVSLRYMEKHHILQIFQITENLVYEKPEDPLSFMLCQVQEMIENRDKSETYKE